MSKGVMGFVKGMGTGIIAGMAVGAVGSVILGKNKKFKRTAGKAVHAVGDLIDNVHFMMK